MKTKKIPGVREREKEKEREKQGERVGDDE